MKTRLTFAAMASAVLLGACASKPVPPDWQANAFAALKGFSSAYLNGNTRLADFEFARAKTEITSTGRADLLARAELTRCAARVASLEFDNCAAYQPLAADAGAAEQHRTLVLAAGDGFGDRDADVRVERVLVAVRAEVSDLMALRAEVRLEQGLEFESRAVAADGHIHLFLPERAAVIDGSLLAKWSIAVFDRLSIQRSLDPVRFRSIL